MSNRLTHSLGGQIRQMQMSNTEFFAYVEGVNVDSFVHGKNCDLALTSMGISHEIIPAKRLPGDAGGKTRLKAFFFELQQKNALVSNFKGKVTVVAFFLDKDVDDKKRLQLQSPHVFYTDYYDVENHVFEEGDIAEAVAAGCSLAINWCRREFGSRSEDWRSVSARKWIGWVKLCYATALLVIPGESNYRRHSPVNMPLHEDADTMLLESFEMRSHRQARDQYAGSCSEWGAARQEVEELYRAGRWDEIFKGKWYAHILASHVKAASPHAFDSRHLEAALVRHVAGTMTFASDWARRMQKGIAALASNNGLPNPV